MMKEYKSIEAAVKDYVLKRDRLRAWTAKRDDEEEKRKAALEEIEVWLLDKSNELGVDSFKTTSGTAYKQIKEHFRVGDWISLTDYVKQTGNFQVFEKRVAKLAVKEIKEKTGKLPDGIDYSSEYVMHVLRPTKKKEKE
jgi:hypothetical protein